MNNVPHKRFETDYAVPPGETVKEFIEFSGITKSEFAKRLGITEQSLYRICGGRQPITPEVARNLELVTGTPATFWNALEFNYQSDLRRINILKEQEENRRWLSEQPVKELVSRGLVTGDTDEARFLSVLSFYATASVSAWRDVWGKELEAAARISCKYKCKPSVAAAWIRSCQLAAAKMNCRDYDREAFLTTLSQICPGYGWEFSEQNLRFLQKRFSETGVALVFVKTFIGAPFEGVTFWKDGKPVIAISLRAGRADKFWFNLFHESHHLLNAGKKLILFTGESRADSEQERLADSFAADSLIPAKYNEEICFVRSVDALAKIASRINVCLDAVLGRRQYLTRNFSRFGKHFQSFRWQDKKWVVAG